MIYLTDSVKRSFSAWAALIKLILTGPPAQWQTTGITEFLNRAAAYWEGAAAKGFSISQ
jgi:hypothetical protein